MLKDDDNIDTDNIDTDNIDTDNNRENVYNMLRNYLPYDKMTEQIYIKTEAVLMNEFMQLDLYNTDDTYNEETKHLNIHSINDIHRLSLSNEDKNFIETHENPDRAPSDGANMININKLESLLKKLKKIDSIVKK